MITSDSTSGIPEELPDDVADLEAELRALTLPERASFAPELEAELTRAWRRMDDEAPAAPRGVARRVLAASLAAVVLTGLAVPPARASLVEGVGRLLEALRPEPVPVDAAPREPVVPVVDPLPALSPAISAGDAGVQPPGQAPAGERRPGRTPAGTAAGPDTRATYPELVDREMEISLILRHYPDELREAGVGGTVRVLLWVDSAGGVDNVQMARGSGLSALDRAALAAAEGLRFRPATRGGRRVGSWVEFDLVFESPMSSDPPVDSGVRSRPGPGAGEGGASGSS